MYYPPLFGGGVRAFDSRPSRENNPLDLSVKSAVGEADDLMLDHRKLASLAASHSAAMGRQLIDPYGRLAYEPLAPPFCAPAALAQLYRGYADPHLRNGLTQREAAAALAATRLYPLPPPPPLLLPAFPLYQHAQPCACCVPSQAALCARSPAAAAKEPAPANDLPFLHRPAATTAATTALSVSSLCASSPEPTPVSKPTSFRGGIWNAGLPVTTSSKTAFSVPAKKNGHHNSSSKEHRSSGSIKDILKDSHHSPEKAKHAKPSYPDTPLRFSHPHDTLPAAPYFPKSSVIKSADTLTTASVTPIVASRCGEAEPLSVIRSPHEAKKAPPPAPLPKPVPAKPIAQHFSSSHFNRAGQHQLSLQSHNEWIPHANPNVTVTSAAPTAAAPLPLFSLDYRFPIASQMNLLAGLPSFAAKTEPPPTPKDSSSSSANKHKKRPAATDDNISSNQPSSAKKRILTADYNTPTPRYLFQPAAFVNEVAEAPECPYTFIPEPPLNYASRVKGDENQKPLWREATEKSQELSREALRSPVLVPAKSPSKPTERAWSPGGVRARRRLRRRLLRRICAQRAPLRPSAAASAAEAAAAADRRLAVRHARKLLSQLTLRWAHRRYMHKWHAIKRRLLLRKKRAAARRKRSAKGVAIQQANKSKSSPCDLVMPPEMKRLMVNKALGETQLHRAARLGYPRAVAYCLKSGCVSLNARDNAGYTPLHECCTRGHLDIARALLQYGADVNASAAGGIRPLHDAVENDHVEIVRLLLSYGADPTIATYSGVEPAKLARSPLMAEFLQGFFADISGEVDSRPHLPWRFWGSAKCLDPEECGADVFGGAPGDGEEECEGEGDNDFLFEVSDSPHLPTFRLAAGAQCNYLRLSDVLRKLNLTKEEFCAAYPNVEVLPLPRYEFEASVTCSPLLGPLPADAATATTDLVRLDNAIRKVLGIETISVR